MNKEKENKNAEISARIAEILQYTGETRNSFATNLGYERAQTVYDILNMKSAPSYDFFRRFSISEYSDMINIRWLLSGKGSMLLSDGVPTVSANPSTAAPEQSDTVMLRFMDKLDEKDNLLKEKEAKIDQLQSELRIKSEELAVFKAKYPQNEPQLEASKDAVKGLGPVKNASTKKPSSPNADNATSANVR